MTFFLPAHLIATHLTDPVALGLLAAASWGAADFAGGLATRRASPSLVVLIAHGTSLVLLALAAVALPVHLTHAAIAQALLSGVVGGVALMVFYHALSLGVMGLAAALAGLLTAVLPVVLSLGELGAPALPQTIGFLVAAAALVLIAYAPPRPGAAPSRRALLLALGAGAGFGLQLVLLHSAAAAAPLDAPAYAPTTSAIRPVLWALLLSRLGGAVAALTARLALRQPPNPASPPAPRIPLPALAALAGLLDTGGNCLYMLSSIAGRLDVAAVLSSLYPGGTILLAALFLRERATALQALGMALALVAVALIAA